MIDKFRFEYPNPTPAEIQGIFDGAPACPSAKTPFSAGLAGKTVHITAEKASFAWTFGTDGSVTVRENSDAPLRVEAGVLELSGLYLVAHRIPGTVRFLAAAIDLERGLGTVCECWFGSAAFPAREVQRVFYSGRIAGSGGGGEKIHEPTGRLTGKALLWKNDAGEREMTIYATAMCSSFLDVGTPNAGDTFTAPSDYLELSYRHFLYSRVEVEFSGGFVLELLDLYTLRSTGMRLALDENNRPVFRMYTAKGKLLGQLAAYGPFQPPAAPVELPPPPPGMEKGFRFAYRPFTMTRPMTCAEIDEVSAKAPIWTGSFRGPNNENSEMMLPCTERLEGMRFSLRFDSGAVWEYEISGKNAMRFRYNGEQNWREERYEAFESDHNLFFMAHTVTGKLPMETMNIALDIDEGLVTCIYNRMGNAAHPREPLQEWLFGIVEAPGITPPKYKRHGFTTELVGRSFTWTYTKAMASQHIYSSPVSYSWSIMMGDGSPGLMWSSPCKYAKIREGIYFMSWIEERSAGNQNAILFNTKTMHDVGACLGINHEQVFEFNTFGAESRSAGFIDLREVYGI
ncbi:MAG: molybdenum cofactor biosynthesis F family protein [Spirochaetaceae bacterium]|nr:molybdenum cofactor biosynthesis F family protein [Spirochaetaceae bacterium]